MGDPPREYSWVRVMNYTLSVCRNWLAVARAGWQPGWLRGIETIRVPTFAGYPTVLGRNATTMSAVSTLAILRPRKELYVFWGWRIVRLLNSAYWWTHLQSPETYMKQPEVLVAINGYHVFITINTCVNRMGRWAKFVIAGATVRFRGMNEWWRINGIYALKNWTQIEGVGKKMLTTET